MEEIRNYIFSNYDIVNNKIIMDSKFVENKYVEVDGKTYDLIQILFYFKKKHLPIIKYLKECEILDIRPIDSHLMYKLSNTSPKEPLSTTIFSIKYDFRFILDHLCKREFKIIVPFSPSSPINIFNCKTILSTGDSRLPPFTKKQLVDPQRSSIRSLDYHKATFHFIYKQPPLHKTNGNIDDKSINSDISKGDQNRTDSIVAVFIDDREWWYNKLDLKEQSCPIFKVANDQDYEFNEQPTIKGKPVKIIRMNGDRLSQQCIYNIWEDIEQYISKQQGNKTK